MAERSLEISEFCELENFSRSMFYKLESQGKAPRTYNVGRKRLISPEARAAWRRDREAESAGEPVAA
jgi:predicted DNA-binding transcriptional regulator AlpA